jgi:heme/copper-type cytochrome/quinol oxidase subunit 2
MVFNLIRSTDTPYADGSAVLESLLSGESDSESQISRNSGTSHQEMDDYFLMICVVIAILLAIIVILIIHAASSRRAHTSDNP